MRGVKAALAALSGGKRSSEKPSSQSCGAENENDSPHASKRLHAPGLGPSVPGSSRRGGQAFTDVTASGTPRALNYGDTSPPKAGRTHQASLARGSPSRGTLSARFGPASARTPHHASRLGSHPLPQAEPADAAAAAADGASGLADASDNIRVVLRVRPRSERESSLTGAVAVHPLGSTAVRVASHPEPHTFSFDYVAGDATGQDTIFQVAGKPIVDNCFAGYNGCIFAYGQTGSGKTYTMLGDEEEGEGAGRGEGRGLIQRVFEHLFARIAASGGKHLLECSFLELYNETITDLLDPSRTGLAVRENLEGPYVSNLTAHEVYRVEDVVSLLHTGQANRRVGETNMNERSSRSHSVFTCKLQSKMVDAYGTTHLRTSRLHLVDLAGSERQKASGAQGERLREATAINKSLSALGNVIMSLVDQQHGRTRHVPYRDSRLTYLLQDSLGGNAKTCLVATVSPAAVNAAETLSTLRFADQAKRIKNQAVVNEDTDGDRAALKKEIKRLQEELAATRRGQAQHPPPLGLATSDGAVADAEADAAWDALPEGQEGRHAALVGALRREEAAVREAARLEAELEGMRSLLKAKDSDLQRSQMMLRLKESRLVRVQAAGPALCDVPTEVAELRQEVELLRGKCDAHPEVKRFAVENLHLGEELRKLEGIVRRGELAALSADVAALRSELLRSDDELARCRDEAEAARQAAQAAQAEAECTAEARVAEQASQLRQQLEEAQYAAAEREAAAAAAAAQNEELQARVALLQGAVLQLESTQADLQSELSPARKAVHRLEQDLGLARQEGTAAALRASTEATLRGQAELSAGQAAARAAALEAELIALRAAQAAMERERSAAAEQAEAAASAELAGVRAELEGERTLAAQRSAEHAEAATQLEAAQRKLAEAEVQAAAAQRAAFETAAELERMRGQHEVAQAEAATRLAAALEAAGEAQRELLVLSAAMAEQQAASDAAAARADGLAQRCCQLQEDSARLASMLAQRNHELMELERSLEKKDAALEAATAEAERLAADAAAAVAAAAARDKEVAADRGQVAEAAAALHVAHEQLSELQERLAAADSQQAQLEFDLSDKSASLQEAAEQATALKRQLGEAQQAQRDSEAAVAAAAAEAAAQLDASRQQSAQLATELAELEGRLEGAKAEAAEQATAAAEARQALAVAREQLAAAEADAESQRWAVGAAAVRSDELAAQLAVLRGTLLEKEQELLLGRAEAQELRQQLAEQEESAEKLRAQVAERDGDLSRLRGDMAAEVSEAAQQVQQLLAAQTRAAALEAELAEARGAAQQPCQLPSQVAEAVAAARAHARAELERLEEQLGQRERELAALRQRCGELEGAAAAAAGGGTAAEQLHQLIAEREGWIEEVQAQRAEATGALEALRALERRFAEVAEERGVLAAAHEELRGRAAKLEEELTAMTGQQNLQQRIHYHAQIKQEAAGLREELSRLRIEHHRAQVRCERVSQELQRVREARGQWGLPDFDAEDALRDVLAATEQRKLQVEVELEGLAGAVLELAAGGAAAQGGDIVLEFGTPRGERQAPTAADARRALADLAAAQAAAARAAEDQAQQIRLLREAGRLQRMRRSSGAAADAEEQQA